MDIDEAVLLTQDRLLEEGESMGELLANFRNRISPVLIGDPQWERILKLARKLPISMGALPFGFELPLHEPGPDADLGVSLASGTRTAEFLKALAQGGQADTTTAAILRLFREMEAEPSPLREIVGRKLMLEYDIGSARNRARPHPGMFLRPGERPIIGGGQFEDVATVVDALESCVGWERDHAQRKLLKRAHLAQPKDTRMDSFGVFPSRSRAVRLAVMGFTTEQELGQYLQDIEWPGQIAAVHSVVSRFRERVNIVRSGANIDIEQEGIGATLGLTLIVKQRYTKDSRYWLDGLTDWAPLLRALRHEELVIPEKLEALAHWVSKPSRLFAKSGQYVLLRGIHHIKLVISENALRKAKAYVFMVLSAAV